MEEAKGPPMTEEGKIDDAEADHDADAAARWKVNQQARTILEKVFFQEPLPSKETVSRLAFQLHVTTRRVQVWFQNRRQRYTRKGVHKRWTASERGVREPTTLLPLRPPASGWLESAGWGESLESPLSRGGGSEPFVPQVELASAALSEGSLAMGATSPKPGFAAPANAGSRSASAGVDAHMPAAVPLAPPAPAVAQLLLEANPPFRIMWSSVGWLELSGYALQQVLGSTLDMFQGAATDAHMVASLVRAASERPGESSAAVVHYRSTGRPFYHVLRMGRLSDSMLSRSQFILVTSELVESCLLYTSPSPRD